MLKGSLSLFAGTVSFGTGFHQTRPALVISLAAWSGASGTALRVVIAVSLCDGRGTASLGGLRIGAGW
jgi:hypothetical protein